MELSSIQKRIDLRLIPAEWDIIRLGDATTKVGSGITPTGGEKVYKKEGRLFMRSQNVGWGQLLLDDIAFIDDETHNSFSETEIKLNDVLLNITGASIGRSAVADQRLLGGNVNQHVCIIRTDTSRLLPLYLNLFMLSDRGQKQIDSFQAGGNRQGLNFQQIRSFQLLLPPLSEQRHIAAALSDVDALIASLDKLIAKKRLIKQGAMQQLLNGKIRLPGFNGEWGIKKLIDECELITKGTTPTTLGKDFKEHGINFIKIESLTEDGSIIREKLTFIDQETNRILGRSQLRTKDILFSIAGALGRTIIINEDILPANTNQALALIRP